LSKYIGDYATGSTLYTYFYTHKADGTPVTFAAGQVYVYKDDSTSTEVNTGVTLSIDHDSITGYNVVKIVLSDAFYASGHDYAIVVTSGTVDGVSVIGYVIATFSIENRNANLKNIAANSITENSIANDAISDAKVKSDVTIASVTGSVGSVDSAVSVTGTVNANLIQILGTAITETVSGYIAAAFKKLFDVVTPLLTCSSAMRGTDGAITSLSGIATTEDVETVGEAVALIPTTAPDLSTITDALDEIKGDGWSDETLKAIKDELDGKQDAYVGSGAIDWDYTVTINSVATAGLEVRVYSDSSRNNLVVTSVTDSSGKCYFALDAGTYYITTIYNHVEYHDTEVVS